jgi:hypothetical protein
MGMNIHKSRANYLTFSLNYTISFTAPQQTYLSDYAAIDHHISATSRSSTAINKCAPTN